LRKGIWAIRISGIGERKKRRRRRRRKRKMRGMGRTV
jgi:hypothetical protein